MLTSEISLNRGASQRKNLVREKKKIKAEKKLTGKFLLETGVLVKNFFRIVCANHKLKSPFPDTRKSQKYSWPPRMILENRKNSPPRYIRNFFSDNYHPPTLRFWKHRQVGVGCFRPWERCTYFEENRYIFICGESGSGKTIIKKFVYLRPSVRM